jgi:hypothetical protein
VDPILCVISLVALLSSCVCLVLMNMLKMLMLIKFTPRIEFYTAVEKCFTVLRCDNDVMLYS